MTGSPAAGRNNSRDAAPGGLMRTRIGRGAVVLGMVGALLCAAAVGLGWWAAAKAIGGVSRVAARLDRGLSEADAGLARVERRLDAVRADLGEVATATGRIAEENPDLPRVRAAVEQLLGRLAPAFDRADAIAVPRRQDRESPGAGAS